MPRRQTPFITGEFYHIFNRSIYRQPIFKRKNDVERFIQVMIYYAQISPSIKFSYYKLNRDKYKTDLNNRIVTLISYCIMPNHFHISIKQEKDKGIQIFMQKALNSYSHYYRIKYHEKGPLFESVFRSIHVETDEQLLHLSRYHHLNPVSSGLIKDPSAYPFSSYRQYLELEEKIGIIDFSYILSHFSSIEKYKDFVLSRKDYQKKLEEIKHLIFH